jgi:hypothetical protein
MTSHETALEAARKHLFNRTPTDDEILAAFRAFASTLSPDVSGLADVRRIERSSRLQANIMRDPLRTGGWEGAEKVADAFEDIADRAADALASLSLQLAAMKEERPWNKASERANDKQGPVFCAVREALDKAHTACFKHPDRDVLGMSSGPFSGVNYALGAVMNLEASLTAAQEENERLRAAPPKHGIYIASKTKHADRWRFLRDKVGEPIISTWIDEAGVGESGNLADLWRRCISEASTAQVLILYREPNEVLKGGWIELGAALSSGVTVFAVGIEEFTVANDTHIQHFPTIKAAIKAASATLSNPSKEDKTDEAAP